MADDEGVRVGRLRWRVVLATRAQVAQAQGTGINDILRNKELVWADVQPVGGLTFWGAQQTETPVTHTITMRWSDSLDQQTVIVRQIQLPGGQVRTELFRVRRIKELGGRKRFVAVEAELEKSYR